MAHITSVGPFLQSIFTFRPMFADSVATSFFNNQPFGYETTIPWNDAIETAYIGPRGVRLTTAFTGDALTISPRDIETGSVTGRVEGIFTYSGHRATGDLLHAASIWGFSLRLADIRTVALTADTTDDKALLKTILAGNDTIRLGAYGDKVASYGGNDLIYAGKGSDVAQGGSGADRLYGQDGYDTLIGGDGNDVLIGGKGADLLHGEHGEDRFVFDDGHLGLGIGARDTIEGWSREDVLDFSQIDGNTRVAGDQRLSFSTDMIEALKPKRNAFWVVADGADMIIRFDVNGDAAHDFELVIADQASMVARIDRDYGLTSELTGLFVH